MTSCIFKIYLRLDARLYAVHRLLGRLYEWVGGLAAGAPEVVVVQGPEHNPAQTLLRHVERLLHGDVDVVEADPLVALVGVGPHDPREGSLDVPAPLDDVDADLVVGQVAVLLGARPLKYNSFVIITTKSPDQNYPKASILCTALGRCFN